MHITRPPILLELIIILGTICTVFDKNVDDLKENVLNEDYDRVSSNQNILLIKNVNKDIFDNL